MIITQSFTRPADATAYAAGDVMNGSGVTVPISFTIPSNMVNPRLKGVSISSSFQTGTFTGSLHLFSATQTVAADNAAYSPTDADVLNYIGTVSIGAAWTSLPANKLSTTILTTEIPLATGNFTSTVFGVLMATGAYTPASGEVFSINLLLA